MEFTSKSSLPPWERPGRTAIVWTLLLMLLSVTKGVDLEKTSLPSSRVSNEKTNISIQISELLKETKTTDSIRFKEKVNDPSESASILSTELLTGAYGVHGGHGQSQTRTQAGSGPNLKTEYPSSEGTSEAEKSQDDAVGKRRSTSTTDSDGYYDAIKPTKAMDGDPEHKIAQTKPGHSGEGKGVSMKKQSRPQKKLKKATSYKRVKRGFGNSFEDDVEEPVKRDESKKKSGKNYNQIAQTLEKIAKVTINDAREQPNKTEVVPPDNFRESRDEENRKASPDIQDIITGIVNILNGKTAKPNESHAGRPTRPTSTRINNRGPPRISDVPPLDFDGPPAYRPIPPKRIPPPYPFDIPPSMPNIPLPPQPHKPGILKLPPHPFIDGVPIPERVVPSVANKLPQPSTGQSESAQVTYDTISASEPIGSQDLPIIDLNTTLAPEVTFTTTNSPRPQNESKPATANPTKNATTISTNRNTTAVPHATTSTGKPDPRPNGPKIPPGNPSGNKNPNKRVRPSPGSRPGEKVPQNKPAAVPPVKTNKNETLATVESFTQKEGYDLLANKGVASTETPQNKTQTKPAGVTGTKPGPVTGTVQPVPRPSTNHPVPEVQDTTFKIPTGEFEKRNRTAASQSVSPSSAVRRPPPKSTAHIVSSNETKFEMDLELPILLEPSVGVGEATPVLESSIPELSVLQSEHAATPTATFTSQTPSQPSTTTTETSHHFKARPGIVLDDPEYKPGSHKRPVMGPRPIVTAPPSHNYYGEIFDVTVHAVQGPGQESTAGKPYIVPVNIDGVQLNNPHGVKGDVAVITKPEEGQNFVSIDGKRTYINLFGEVSPTKINPTTSQVSIIGTGYAIPHKESPVHPPPVGRPVMSTSPPRRPYKRPSHPPVRIDTCIVGDDTTCDSAQNEMCRTEDGVSSCHCRPGYNRKKHRDSCRRVVSMLTSLRVDRLYDRKVKWQDNLRDPDSEDYQQLSYEASQAIESAMSMTPFSDDFINSRINSIYAAKNLENNEPAVYVNLTIQLEENFDTVRPAVKQDIQRHLLRVIQRRNNNVGNSALWVNAPPGSVLALQDVDECSSAELHDCHERAFCHNTFGSFRCQCPEGLRDPWIGNIHREGRYCESCPSDYCNGRGECKFEHGQQVCHCSGSFYGSQCEIDGEVLGVAIGASVAAAIIIILTLICLCMWSRRWSREQKSAVGAGMGSPVFGYMATGPAVKTPSVGAPPYQVSIEDRIRWAQIADVMAKSNHYAQPEPVNTNTRPAFGGYPTLPSHTMSMTGTLPLPAIAPPVPLPRLSLANKPVMGTYGAHSQLGSVHQSNHGIRSSVETTSSSEEEDRADLLGRNFNAPRPKSRTSIANQSGIYYDVDFDRSDAYSKQNTIPMNTYTLNSSQHQSRPFYR